MSNQCVQLAILLLLISPWIFVLSECLIARNVAELFSSNHGISHFYAAWHINELSRGSIWGSKILTTIGLGSILSELAKNVFLMVLCFETNLSIKLLLPLLGQTILLCRWLLLLPRRSPRHRAVTAATTAWGSSSGLQDIRSWIMLDFEMSKKGPNSRHGCVRATCCRYVVRHVSDMTSYYVKKRSKRLTCLCPKMSIANMSACTYMEISTIWVSTPPCTSERKYNRERGMRHISTQKCCCCYRCCNRCCNRCCHHYANAAADAAASRA